jgi:hypothetical protein
MGLDKSAYSRILDNVGSIVPCPFFRTDPLNEGQPILNVALSTYLRCFSFRNVPS